MSRFNVTNTVEISENAYTFTLFDVTLQEMTDIKLSVVGKDHPKVRQRAYSINNQYNQLKATKKRNKKDPEVMDREDLEFFKEMGQESALTRLVGWSGVKVDGKEVPFSAADAREFVCEEGHEWIVDAITKESEELSNFTKS